MRFFGAGEKGEGEGGGGGRRGFCSAVQNNIYRALHGTFTRTEGSEKIRRFHFFLKGEREYAHGCSLNVI